MSSPVSTWMGDRTISHSEFELGPFLIYILRFNCISKCHFSLRNSINHCRMLVLQGHCPLVLLCHILPLSRHPNPNIDCYFRFGCEQGRRRSSCINGGGGRTPLLATGTMGASADSRRSSSSLLKRSTGGGGPWLSVSEVGTRNS